MTITWHTETRKLSDLTPADYNPRQLSEKQGKELKRSLEKFGYVETIDINTDNTVIGGHQRLKILADLKAEEIEVRVPDRKLTKKEEKELNLRLNKNTGEFSFELLLDNFDIDMLEDVGFDLDDLNIEDDEIVQDELPDAKNLKSIVKTGDLWQLGRHKLHCIDSIKNNHLLQDIGELIVTDPPYDLEINKLYSTLFTNRLIMLAGGKLAFHFFRNKEWNISIDLVWHHKTPRSIPSKSRPIYYHNNILFCFKEDYKMGFKRPAPNFGSILEYNFEKLDEHGQQKPVLLFVDILKCVDDDIIIDPFLGSGTTLVACEQLGKTCIGAEINERYCDLIIARWEKLTNEKAIKL